MSGNHNTKSNDEERLLNAELLVEHWMGSYYAADRQLEKVEQRIKELEQALVAHRSALDVALKALEHSHANEPIWKTPHREAIAKLKEVRRVPH